MTGGGGGLNPFFEGEAQQRGLPIEEHPADGDNEDADGNQQPVERAHHAGEMIFFGSCLIGQLGGVGICPHVSKNGVAFSRDDKAPRQKLAAHALGNFVGLSCDQGFVDLHGAGNHLGIGGNLIACG